MSTHSVAEAKNNLSKLIDRALKGEGIVITRRGQPVVQLTPLQPPLRRDNAAGLNWLREHRIGRISDKDAATLIRELRDEEWI